VLSVVKCYDASCERDHLRRRGSCRRRLVSAIPRESIFTEADSLEELHEAVRDAVRCHFEEADMPKLIRLHTVREELLAV
jgi:hypothetical protein